MLYIVNVNLYENIAAERNLTGYSFDLKQDLKHEVWIFSE